jgi:hypothetical protein
MGRHGGSTTGSRPSVCCARADVGTATRRGLLQAPVRPPSCSRSLGKLEATRLMTWNCRLGAFRKKAAQVVSVEPDVVVPECENVQRELLLDGRAAEGVLGGAACPYSHRLAFGRSSPSRWRRSSSRLRHAGCRTS